MGFRTLVTAASATALAVTTLHSSPLPSQSAAHPLVQRIVLDAQAGQISSQAHIAVGSDGMFILLNPDGGPAALYAANGTEVAVLNPAEPAAVGASQIGWAADSPWVKTGTTVDIYSRTGRWARAISLLITVQGPPGSSPITHGDQLIARAPLEAVYANGGLLLSERSLSFVGPLKPDLGFAALLVKVTDRGGFRGTMGYAFAGDGGCRVHVAGTIMLAKPFCILPKAAISPNGTAYANVTTLRSNGDSSWLRISVLRNPTDTLFARTISLPTVPVSLRARDSSLDVLRKQLAGAPTPHLADSAMLAMRANFAKSQQPISNMLVGDDGSVWMQGQLRGTNREWIVLTAAEPSPTIVNAPATVRIQQIVGASGWGLDAGLDGMITVERFDIP